MQAYIRDQESRLPRPEKELQAFDKVFLKPGETKDATLTLDKYSVGYYDTNLNAWIAEAGVFEVLVGASSVDIRYVSLSSITLRSPSDTSRLGELLHSRSRSHLLGYFEEFMTARWDSHSRIYTAVTPSSLVGIGFLAHCTYFLPTNSSFSSGNPLLEHDGFLPTTPIFKYPRDSNTSL